jgi:hypothetical protein
VPTALTATVGNLTARPAGGPGRTRLPPAIHLAIAGGALVVAAALAATGRPLIATGVLVSGVVALAVLPRPWVALALLLIVELTNVSSVAGQHGGLGLSSAVLLLALGAVALGWDGRAVQAVVTSPVVRLAGLWLCLRAISAVGAADPGASVADVAGTAKDLLFLVVVAVLILIAGRYVDAVKVAVAVLAILAAVTVVQDFALHNSTTLGGFSNLGAVNEAGAVSSRHSGPQSDANFWGRLLVLYLPFALSLLVIARGRARFAWAAVPPLLLAGVILSGSRGAMIACGLAVVLWLVLAGRAFGRLLFLLPVLAVVVALIPGGGSRLATLSSLGNPSGTGTDLSLVNRLAAQEAGVRMFLDHPVLGVGAGNFLEEEREYLRETGNLEFTEILDPHNTYLEMAAEGGILTLAAWLLFYGAALLAAARASLQGRAAGGSIGRAYELLAMAALVGLIAWATASVFLHLTVLRSLLAVMAVAVALEVVTRRMAGRTLTSGPPVGVDPPAAPAGRRAHWFLAGALALAAFVAVGAALATGQRWTASAAGVVVPNPRLSRAGQNAYDHDVLTRGLVVPTLAAVLADGRFEREAARRLGVDPRANGVDVRVASAPASAVITVTAGADDHRAAAGMAREILRSGMRFVSQIDGLYVIRSGAHGDAPRLSLQRATAPAAILAYGVAVLLGLATLVVMAVSFIPSAVGRLRRRRSQ